MMQEALVVAMNIHRMNLTQKRSTSALLRQPPLRLLDVGYSLNGV